VEDQRVIEQINKLADEEHDLFKRRTRGSLSEEERERLHRLEVTLDQCWDLLRQRRALRSAGLDPKEAKVRPEDVVEGYKG
jgi:uncharacterized protein DUF2630